MNTSSTFRQLPAALAALSWLVAPPAAAELKAGDPAPAFEADATLAGQPYRFVLGEALKKGPVVLYFYPKAFTKGCTIEANAFAEASPQYEAMKATVIGVSGDDIDTLKQFSMTECRNRFAVASDRTGRIMKSYDAAMPLVEGYAKRISYVISPRGQIVYAWSSMSPDGHVPNTLAAVRRWIDQQSQPSGGN